MQSQWVHGHNGPTGLNWASLRAHPAVREGLRALEAGEREARLHGLAVMEQAWLAERARISAEQARQQGQG